MLGSGKTIVALLLAMAAVVEDGAQAAIMAPTEISGASAPSPQSVKYCGTLIFNVEILTGREKGKIRAQSDI